MSDGKVYFHMTLEQIFKVVHGKHVFIRAAKSVSLLERCVWGDHLSFESHLIDSLLNVHKIHV